MTDADVRKQKANLQLVYLHVVSFNGFFFVVVVHFILASYIIFFLMTDKDLVGWQRGDFWHVKY